MLGACGGQIPNCCNSRKEKQKIISFKLKCHTIVAQQNTNSDTKVKANSVNVICVTPQRNQYHGNNHVQCPE